MSTRRCVKTVSWQDGPVSRRHRSCQDGFLSMRCRVSTTPCQHDGVSTRCRVNTTPCQNKVPCQHGVLSRRHRVKSMPCQKRCFKTVPCQDDIFLRNILSRRRFVKTVSPPKNNVVPGRCRVKAAPCKRGVVSKRCRVKKMS